MVLVLFDVVFMLPPTIVGTAILRREERETEGVKVSHNYSCMYVHTYIDKLYMYLCRMEIYQ